MMQAKENLDSTKDDDEKIKNLKHSKRKKF